MVRTNRTDRSAKEAVRTTSNVSGNTQGNDTIDLRELFYRLMENLKYILATALFGSIIMGVVTLYFITPQYKTTSKIYVMNPGDSAINLSDLQIGTYLTSDYMEVFNNWIVHERVIQALGLPYSYQKLRSMLSVTNPSNTRILYITITSADPQEAKAIADTYAKVAQEFITTTMDTKEPSLFEEALLPTAPFSPNKLKNIAQGFLAGLFLSSGMVMFIFITGDKIRTSENIEKYAGLPTLGIISMQKKEFPNRPKSADKRKEKRKKGSVSV
jgi:capsular polysaccharide biosynthesis protein